MKSNWQDEQLNLNYLTSHEIVNLNSDINKNYLAFITDVALFYENSVIPRSMVS